MLVLRSRCKRRVYLFAACACRKYNIFGIYNCWDDATLPFPLPGSQRRATACTIRGMDCVYPGQDAPSQRLTNGNVARYDLLELSDARKEVQMSADQQKFRLVTRSDFDGLVCAVLLKHLDLIDDILIYFFAPETPEPGQ